MLKHSNEPHSVALDRLGIRKYDGDRYEVLCLKKADFKGR